MAREKQGGKAPVDPYGQPIEFNGKHVTLSDYEGERVNSVPTDDDAEVARQIRTRELDRFAARYGIPGLLLLAVALKLLGLDLELTAL